MLPVLVVLFLVSYGLMTLVIVEQGSTIESQHDLIGQLLGDTRELAAMKGNAIRQQALSRQAQAKKDQPPAQTQAPNAGTPSTQAGPKNPGTKAQRPVPVRPPKPASDMVDVRRNLLSI